MTQGLKIALPIIGILMGVLLLVLVFGDKGLLALKHKRADHAKLLQANEKLTRANVRLSRTIDRLRHDPEFLEALARRESGMIRADELIFQFRSANPRSVP